ncbi:MAG: CapA family protein [bacterium]
MKIIEVEYKDNRKRNFILISISIICFCIAIITSILTFIYFNKDTLVGKKNIVEATQIPTPTPPVYIDYSYYYAPVTGFKDIRNNISLSDLKANKVFVKTSESLKIKQAFPEFNTENIEDTLFNDRIANSNEIGLILWSDLNPRLKLLNIENKNILDKTQDLSLYPLKYDEKILESETIPENYDLKSVNRILTMGEIIPARTVDKVMRTKNDYIWPFKEVKTFMDKYDARVATFEAALQGVGNGNVCALNCFTFIANEKFTEGMVYSGINVVSLADNHSMSAGTEGVFNTIKLLNNAGIKTLGASPTNNEDATRPIIHEVNGVKYGFIAYNDIPSPSDWATDTAGGTARIDTNEYQIIDGRVRTDVKRAKDMGAQYIIALMHWGSREYTNDPMPHQKELAHNLIDNGVDLIIGDHPHWVMSVEFYTPPGSTEPKFIYYGIGNFIFDQSWSTETSQGSFAELDFYKDKLLSIHIYPHQIYDMSQPRLLPESSKEYKQIMDRIWQFTDKI